MEKSTNTITSIASSTPPTTFVQADTNTFRELVQKLTGAADDDNSEKLPITLPARFAGRSNSGDIGGPRRSAFKLQERRNNMRKLEIKLGLTSLRSFGGFSPRQAAAGVSPIQSPVTPLGSDRLFSGQYSGSGSDSPSPVVSEEEKAIAEKGFYLHPSPLSTPRGSDPPELLTLFPLRSPKQSADR
eukprot:TRINITY_DN20195_c0_g1_i1.p1 TRINITY_DN20195_c0_g1~~TRINITY_DN20195_c0_g1_i1.p1  ORF type:complete len:186 (+),score=10.20 TRINITY_DN20195_c0_g1_i1:318-875(+)